MKKFQAQVKQGKNTKISPLEYILAGLFWIDCERAILSPKSKDLGNDMDQLHPISQINLLPLIISIVIVIASVNTFVLSFFHQGN